MSPPTHNDPADVAFGYEPMPSRRERNSSVREAGPVLGQVLARGRFGVLWGSGSLFEDQPIIVDKVVWDRAKEYSWRVECGGDAIIVRAAIEGKHVMLTSIVKEVLWPEAIGQKLWKKRPRAWWDFRLSNLTLQRPGPGGGRQWAKMPKKTELREIFLAAPELGRLPTDEEHLKSRMVPVPPPKAPDAERSGLWIQQKRRKSW